MNNKLLVKIFCGALSAAMFLALATGCDKDKGENVHSGGNTASAATDAPSQNDDAVVNTEKGFFESDLNIVINGKVLKIGGKESTIKDVLGEPVSIDAAESCIFDGDERFYTYDNCVIFTFPAQNGSTDNTIDEVYFFGENVPAVGKGVITIGSTFEEVEEAFGMNYFMDGDSMMVFNIENDPEKKDILPKLYFEFTDSKVSGIGYCANLYHAEG